MTNEIIYGAYILIWPALTLGVLSVISWAVFCDARSARQAQQGVQERVQERAQARVQQRAVGRAQETARSKSRERMSDSRGHHNHAGQLAG